MLPAGFLLGFEEVELKNAGNENQKVKALFEKADRENLKSAERIAALRFLPRNFATPMTN